MGMNHVMEEEMMRKRMILAGMTEQSEISLLLSLGFGSFCHLADCCRLQSEIHLLQQQADLLVSAHKGLMSSNC